mgnify:CR=1 FL=1
MKIKWIQILGVLFALSLASCSKDSDPDPDPNNGGQGGNNVTPENVSYTNFAGSLFQGRCSHCHTGSGEGITHWTFTGYTSVTSNLERIKDVTVVTRAMPKDGSLTTAQVELLKAWFDKGAPQN